MARLLPEVAAARQDLTHQALAQRVLVRLAVEALRDGAEARQALAHRAQAHCQSR